MTKNNNTRQKGRRANNGHTQNTPNTQTLSAPTALTRKENGSSQHMTTRLHERLGSVIVPADTEFNRAKGHYKADADDSTFFCLIKQVVQPGLKGAVEAGVSALGFPLLAEAAGTFEEYCFKKLEYAFRPQMPTDTPGEVIMGFSPESTTSRPEDEVQAADQAVSSSASVWAPNTLRIPKNVLNATRYLRTSPGPRPGEDVRIDDVGSFFVSAAGFVAPPEMQAKRHKLRKIDHFGREYFEEIDGHDIGAITVDYDCHFFGTEKRNGEDVPSLIVTSYTKFGQVATEKYLDTLLAAARAPPPTGETWKHILYSACEQVARNKKMCLSDPECLRLDDVCRVIAGFCRQADVQVSENVVVERKELDSPSAWAQANGYYNELMSWEGPPEGAGGYHTFRMQDGNYNLQFTWSGSFFFQISQIDIAPDVAIAVHLQQQILDPDSDDAVWEDITYNSGLPSDYRNQSTLPIDTMPCYAATFPPRYSTSQVGDFFAWSESITFPPLPIKISSDREYRFRFRTLYASVTGTLNLPVTVTNDASLFGVFIAA